MPAAAAGQESWSEYPGYSGLSIQAVGYEHGKENPKVHIYVTRGSVGALKKLRSEIDGIPVQINNIGELKIRPEMASNTTAHGNLFIHQGRVACGSSCAPSGETYSGTMGAIARDSNNQLLVLSNNHVLAACNHVPVGMPVMAPSNSDARPNKPAPWRLAAIIRSSNCAAENPLWSPVPRWMLPSLSSLIPSMSPLGKETMAMDTIPRHPSGRPWPGCE